MKSLRARTALAAGLVAALLVLGPAPAAGAASPDLRLTALANGAVAPGGTTVIRAEVFNVGDADLDASANPVSFGVTLPPGLKATAVAPLAGDASTQTPEHWGCASTVFPSSSVSCMDSSDQFIAGSFTSGRVILQVTVAASAALAAGSVKTVAFRVSGGGAPARSVVASIEVASGPASFGLAALDANLAADAAGSPSTAAGAHPYSSSVSFELETHNVPVPYKGDRWPVEPVKDVVASLPAGLIGDPATLAECTDEELGQTNQLEPRPTCPSGSQVGTVVVRTHGTVVIPESYGPLPVFNMTPPPGTPARFGFNVLGTPIALDARLRSDGDYGFDIVNRDTPEALPLDGTTVTLWGAPAAAAHDSERVCPGGGPLFAAGPRCPGGSPSAFLRNPTRCASAAELATTLSVDSWFHPGATLAGGVPDLSDPDWKSASAEPHQLPGYPYPPSEWGASVGLEGCASEPFSPSISAQPTTRAADSPSGLSFDLTMPQQGLEDPSAISESDLRTARVKLPEGMTVNASSANGLGACTSSQVGMTSAPGATPVRFDPLPAKCPDDSKIGTVRIETPLLGETDSPEEGTLEGSVYLAAQQDNPFGSLLAMYVAVHDERTGLVLKLPGRIEANRGTGQLETIFDENPQTPFTRLHLQLFGGARAALRTPGCGTHTVTSSLTPWSGGADAHPSSSFKIDQGCGGGFDPHFSAGTADPLAATTSPFSLRLWREDGSQELGGLTAQLPLGLSGYLKGIPYCPDAALASVSGELGTGRGQESASSCPAASQVGTVTVGAGTGPSPFYTAAGHAYLAGPYKGAPLSLAVVVPAVAGPFDLGSVVVRNALQVDPETARITVESDPFPTVLHGIALDLRDIRVDIDRPSFTLNPTSCAEKRIVAAVTSTSGTAADPLVRFQVGGCGRLGFRPRLSLRLRGGVRRADNPGLTAVLRPKRGNANLRRVQVALPHSEFLDQSHIKTICTRVQFAAEQCPRGSVYGKVAATSPLLGYELTGNVYLRSSNHTLPDMVLALRGPASQPIAIDAVGRIDSHKGGIRTTFEGLPDAPLTKVVLTLPAGKKSLIENSTNICRHRQKAEVKMAGQNGKAHDFKAPLRVKCPKGAKKSSKAKHAKAGHVRGRHGGR